MTQGNPETPKKIWAKPELKEIRAGSAENDTPDNIPDGPVQLS